MCELAELVAADQRVRLVSTGSPRAVRMIRWYQRAFDGRLSPCRFTPSCSSYALEAFETHGTRRGASLTVASSDPVPTVRPFGMGPGA